MSSTAFLDALPDDAAKVHARTLEGDLAIQSMFLGGGEFEMGGGGIYDIRYPSGIPGPLTRNRLVGSTKPSWSGASRSGRIGPTSCTVDANPTASSSAGPPSPAKVCMRTSVGNIFSHSGLPSAS